MITLTDSDAAWLAEHLTATDDDQPRAARLLTAGSTCCDRHRTDGPYQCSTTQACCDDCPTRPQLLTAVPEPDDDGCPIIDRCYCNQPTDQRVNSHRRGDPRFCRDTIERAADE